MLLDDERGDLTAGGDRESGRSVVGLDLDDQGSQDVDPERSAGTAGSRGRPTSEWRCGRRSSVRALIVVVGTAATGM